MVPEEERGNFALIRFLNRIHQLDRQIWGHPIAAVLVRTILEGELQDRLHDYTSLAAATGLPVATVDRRVNALLSAGLIARSRVGRSYRLTVTARTRDLSRGQEEAAFRALRELNSALDVPHGAFRSDGPTAGDDGPAAEGDGTGLAEA
jgi:DNA-binding transcriptional ArsR family regulator